ncbi:uncharacterized protein LOC116294360 [Actinia tenebrosa]|uniref:Uncharacterized protein LOC116294360 n=1 Tax=Actinia tenebrosa TaxID=6105 RepID=A0A6P8HN69_ACTTE|nr:uncharacterized protein LOC116294360 [Actinia tenebrosa]
MSFGKTTESFLCLLAMIAGFFTTVPLGLLNAETGNTCLLFATVDVLQKNVTGGNIIYCNLGFYSSITTIVLAAFLICFRWCCLVNTEKPSMLYGYLTSLVFATLGWINSVVCAVFMVSGFVEWCKSIQKGLASGSSCEAAKKWEWSSFKPQPLDASNFYVYLTMVEISSYSSIVLWFLVAFISGTQLRKWIDNTRNLQTPYINHEIHTHLPGVMGMFEPEHQYSINQIHNSQMRHAGVYEDVSDDMDSQIEYGRITHL